MQTTVLNVAGLNNSNSATAIKNAVSSLQGVSNVAVDINTSKVTVTFDPESTNISAIRNAIAQTGHYIQ